MNLEMNQDDLQYIKDKVEEDSKDLRKILQYERENKKYNKNYPDLVEDVL